jgi:hypothetical protein
MRKYIVTLIASLFLLPLLAQVDLPRPNLNPFNNGTSSILSLDRLSVSHSMGFEAGTSSVGDGYYLSRYTNHMKYTFNPKLELDLDLNFVNFGSMNTASRFEFNDDNANRIIPEFSLRYKPSDSISIQVQMNHSGYLNSPFYNRYNDKW